MQRVRSRMLKDQAQIEASDRARKQREIKKFGKKVRCALLRERRPATAFLLTYSCRPSPPRSPGATKYPRIP